MATFQAVLPGEVPSGRNAQPTRGETRKWKQRPWSDRQRDHEQAEQESGAVVPPGAEKAKRRGRDSNPRWTQGPHRFSRPARSATPAPLREAVICGRAAVLSFDAAKRASRPRSPVGREPVPELDCRKRRGSAKYPQGDSNPCHWTENPVSWAARRWGRDRFFHRGRCTACRSIATPVKRRAADVIRTARPHDSWISSVACQADQGNPAIRRRRVRTGQADRRHHRCRKTASPASQADLRMLSADCERRCTRYRKRCPLSTQLVNWS